MIDLVEKVELILNFARKSKKSKKIVYLKKFKKHSTISTGNNL